MECSTKVNISKSNKCMEAKVIKPKIRRRFLGKLDNFTDKQDRNFNKKMLKAYLRGKENFSFGVDSESKKPIYFKVLQEYYEVK